MNRKADRKLAALLNGFGDVAPDLTGLEIIDRISEQAVWWCLEGQAEMAKELIFSAIGLCRNTLGAVHSDTLALVKGAVTALGSRPEYWATIETCVIKSLKECERGVGNDHPETFQMREALACASTLKGDHLSAEMILAETLHRRELALGLTHPDVTTNVLLLAYRICHHGEPNRAVELLRHQLHKRELRCLNDGSVREIKEALTDILASTSSSPPLPPADLRLGRRWKQQCF